MVGTNNNEIPSLRKSREHNLTAKQYYEAKVKTKLFFIHMYTYVRTYTKLLVFNRKIGIV